MWSLVERAKKIIFALILSVIPLVLLYAQSKDAEIRSILAWPIVEFSGALEKFAVRLSGGISDGLFRYFFLANRGDELLRLRAEVLETRALKAQLLNMINDRSAILELYLNTPSSEPKNREFARVVARAGAPMARLIRLDKGSLHGIKVRSPVLAHEGVVGQVLSVAPNYCDVLLITDAGSAIEAKVMGGSARGILRGITSNAHYLLEIRDVEGIAQVRPGDVVVTSGVNSFFPGGLPIGEIINIKKSRDGLNISARIKPYVHMDTVSNVVVLLDDWSLAGNVGPFSATWPVAIR
ncbi:MAG TPA: rod shape-determining protein MreC [Myxococcota bacterium]|nr:rod shape-determining protein MreC [Myxococcota bacterium]